jgi:hypothetical protein
LIVNPSRNGSFIQIGKFMQQKELAALLGISPAMVSRLVKRGMPTTLEGAQRWRKRHLEPGRVKGSRFDPKQPSKATAPEPATPDTAAAALAGELLAEVEAACVEFDNALNEGDQAWAGVMLQRVRELMRLTPDDAKPRLSLRVWLALVDWFIHPGCAIHNAPDKAALLNPVEFGMRWHGWDDYPLLNEHTLDQARDWNDYSIKGWPTCPDDDKLDAMAAET